MTTGAGTGRGTSVLLLLVAFIAAVGAAPKLNTKDDLEIRDCGSVAEIKSIAMDGCSAYPCEVASGTHAIGRVTMSAKSVASVLTCKIVGVIPPGIELPWNGCPPDGCQNLSTGTCPTEVGEEIVYEIDILMEPYYPHIEVTGKWRLIDQDGNDFLCFEIPMKITA